MSDIFKTEKSETPSDTPAQDNQTGSALEQLVGDGKKFQDPESLAKGKLEADRYIEELKGQLNQYKEQADRSMSMESFLTKLEERSKPAESPTQQEQVAQPNDQNQAATITEDQINAIVASKLNEVTDLQRREANAQAAIEGLKKLNKSGEDIASVAREMGVTNEFMQEMAEKSPQAFLKVMGAETSSSDSPNPLPTGNAPPSSRSQVFQPQSGEKNWKYYQEMRKKDLNRYMSAEVQQEIYKAAMEKGPDFYN